jgi:hypothetical protein
MRFFGHQFLACLNLGYLALKAHPISLLRKTGATADEEPNAVLFRFPERKSSELSYKAEEISRELRPLKSLSDR